MSSKEKKKFLSENQLKKSTPQELVKYKQKLNKIHLDLKADVEEFIHFYTLTKKHMNERLIYLEKLADSIEDERLNSDDYDLDLSSLN